MNLKAGLVLCLLVFHLPGQVLSQVTDTETSPKTTLHALHVAFNAHDVAGMRRHWHDDIVGFAVEGDKVTVMSRSADALAAEMTAYFSALPDVRTSFYHIALNGNYLSFIETVSWTGKDGSPRRQSSTAVYEMESNRVRRYWYYPAQ
jgi:hypothetical protein